MSRTAKLREQIEALNIDSADLVERIVSQAEQLLGASQNFVEQGQEVQMCFFLIPREGDIKIFMPSASMIGLPRMSADQEKGIIASAVRQLASESKAMAVIHICEAFSLKMNPNDMTAQDMALIDAKGIRAHPKAVEIVHCSVSLNCRGQSHNFSAAYAIEGKLPDRRTMSEFMDWEHMGQSEGRFVIEAMYLEPLT